MPVTAATVSAMRFLPLIGAISLVLIGLGWRSWLQRGRYGTWGIVLSGPGATMQFAQAAGLIFAFVLLIGQAFVTALNPAGVNPLVRFPPQGAMTLSIIGTALMAGGIALLVAAQLEMGASWRVGIDQSATPGLVDTGLFRFCRNPIYLALLAAMAGYCALLPTAISLTI
jgi:protein-S-isoprenylcysteine O-methyltransferase Ste14